MKKNPKLMRNIIRKIMMIMMKKMIPAMMTLSFQQSPWRLYQPSMITGLQKNISKNIRLIFSRIGKKLINLSESALSKTKAKSKKLQNFSKPSEKKFQQIKLAKDQNKIEVNNFGFPSSFGEAGVDFPMYDPNNLPDTSFR